MNEILTDCRALKVVTPEMLDMRNCPECSARGCMKFIDVLRYSHYPKSCKTCKGTRLNPDQSKWWAALCEADENEHLMPLLYDATVINFAEVPDRGEYHICPLHFPGNFRSCYRPENDNRPWPEVLRDLVMHLSGCFFGEPRRLHGFDNGDPTDGYPNISEPGPQIKDVFFALATKKTAHVFKTFGIKTLVEA